jgi:hypothetical protein
MKDSRRYARVVAAVQVEVFMRRLVLAVTVFALLLAGCGGGHGIHMLPTGQFGSTGGGRGDRSNNVTTFNGTLWYGDDRALYGVPLSNGAPTTEIDGSYSGIVDHQSRAMTISPDGTVFELIQNNATNVSWQLRLYPPGTHGPATPEGTIYGTGYPQQVMLVSDGIDVLWSTQQPGTGGNSTLSTYSYNVVGLNPQPIRTMPLGQNVSDVAVDSGDKIYVARAGGGGVTVYPAGSTCACAAVRTIATGLQVQRSIAVARDGTVYVLTRDPAAEISHVNAYAPGNDSATPSRSLGPFYENSDVAPGGWMASSPTGGITVDAAGDVYIGFADNSGQVRVEIYAPNQSGGGPGRTIATPSFSTYLTSIAIGPMTAGRAIAPTLYVASGSQILAFAADASGNAKPQHTLGGFWYRPAMDPGHHISSALGAIATAADGTLDVLTNSTGFHSQSCSIGAFDPSGAHVGDLVCRGRRGDAMARGQDGEVDVLLTSFSYAPAVQTLVNGVLTGSFAITTSVGHHGIAVGRDGSMYLTTGDGRVEIYPADSVDGTAPSSFALAGGLGSICAAPDGTLYVAAGLPAAGGGSTDYVYAVAPGTTTPTRTLGPFAQSVTALGCGAQNEIYVGLSMRDHGGSQVSVFAANAASGSAPSRTLTNPIPLDDPAGPYIVSLSLSP